MYMCNSIGNYRELELLGLSGIIFCQIRRTQINEVLPGWIVEQVYICMIVEFKTTKNVQYKANVSHQVSR